MQKSLRTTNIIKNNGQNIEDKSRSNIVKNQVLKAQKKAKEIVEEAESFAKDLRESTIKESEIKLEIAYNKGTENALLEFETNLIKAKEIRENMLRETEKDILKLSVRLAEKIIGKVLVEDDKTIVNIVSTALQNARQKERITIRVNPADLQNIQAEEEQLKASAQTKYIDFLADPRVENGGCIIESEVGTVDARLDTQFRVLERALLAQADGEFLTGSN